MNDEKPDKGFVPTLDTGGDPGTVDRGNTGSGAGSDGDGHADEAQSADTVNTKVSDLPQSNAPTGSAPGGGVDQSKNTGTPEVSDYSKPVPDRSMVVSTHDRMDTQTGPESIGAGGAGNPRPGKGPGDGNSTEPLGDPDAPQGTGPEVNSKTLGSREANNVLGEVRTSHRAGAPRE
jgi:hypothetical protein